MTFTLVAQSSNTILTKTNWNNTWGRYGAFDAWMVEAIGGLRVVSNATVTAWEHFTVSPNAAAVVRLSSGGQTIRTRFGVTSLDWLWDARALCFHGTFPAYSVSFIGP